MYPGPRRARNTDGANSPTSTTRADSHKKTQGLRARACRLGSSAWEGAPGQRYTVAERRASSSWQVVRMRECAHVSKDFNIQILSQSPKSHFPKTVFFGIFLYPERYPELRQLEPMHAESYYHPHDCRPLALASWSQFEFESIVSSRRDARALRCKPTIHHRVQGPVGCARADRALAVLRRSLESEFTLMTNVVKVNQLQMTPDTQLVPLPLAPPAAPAADAAVVPIATAQARGLVFIPYQ